MKTLVDTQLERLQLNWFLDYFVGLKGSLGSKTVKKEKCTQKIRGSEEFSLKNTMT